MRLRLLFGSFMLFTAPAYGQYVGAGNKAFTDDLYYGPSFYNIPLFQGEKELSVSAYVISSYGVNAAYSITSHFNVSGSYGYTPRDERHINNYEAGVGYFNFFGKNKQWVYEATGLAGIGNADVQLKSNNMKERLSYYRISFQGTIGFRHRIIETALSPRICVFTFYGYEDLNGEGTHEWLYGERLDGKSGTVLETNAMVRVGSPRIKFGMQLGVPAMLNDKSWEVNFYDRFNFLLTVSYRWGFMKNAEG